MNMETAKKLMDLASCNKLGISLWYLAPYTHDTKNKQIMNTIDEYFNNNSAECENFMDTLCKSLINEYGIAVIEPIYSRDVDHITWSVIPDESKLTIQIPLYNMKRRPFIIAQIYEKNNGGFVDITHIMSTLVLNDCNDFKLINYPKYPAISLTYTICDTNTVSNDGDNCD